VKAPYEIKDYNFWRSFDVEIVVFVLNIFMMLFCIYQTAKINRLLKTPRQDFLDFISLTTEDVDESDDIPVDEINGLGTDKDQLKAKKLKA